MRFRKSVRAQLDPRIVADFNRTILLIEDPDSLQASVAVHLREIFGCEGVLILQSEGNLAFGPGFQVGIPTGELSAVRIERRGPLARWLLTNETPLFVDGQPEIVASFSPEERRLLARLRVSVCLPLLVLNRLTGMVLLGAGPGEGEWRFDPQQQELLLALSGQIGLALENATLHRQQRERLKRLYRAERLAAAGQLAAGVAHEIRNPLTSIRSTIQYVLASYGPEDPNRGLLEELIAEVDRIDRIVNDLMSLGRPNAFHPGEVDLIELLEHSLLLIGPQARKQGVEVQFDAVDARLRLTADPGQLKQVFLNLYLNALQAMPEGGSLQVAVQRCRNEAGGPDRVEIAVIDSGTGIAEEHLDEVFDPFFTLKQEGTGLGLSVCYNLVQQHDGEIELESRPGGGTTVRVRLPGLQAEGEGHRSGVRGVRGKGD